MLNTLRLLSVTTLLLLLTACFGPKTPREVTQAFWDGVLVDDLQTVVDYSTLVRGADYDGFGKQWSGYQMVLGRMLQEGERAEIVADFTKIGLTDGESRNITTYLIRQNDQWLVDYQQTASVLHEKEKPPEPEPMAELGERLSRQFGASAESLGREVERLSDDIGQQVEQISSELGKEVERLSADLSREAERLSEELNAFTDDLGEQADEGVKRYADQLRARIDELADSLRNALKQKRNELSNEERGTLQETLDNLEREDDRLDGAGRASLAELGQQLDKAQQELADIDGGAGLEEYQTEWNQWRERWQDDMQQLRDKLEAEHRGPTI